MATIEEKKIFLKRYGWISDSLDELKEEIERLCLSVMLPRGISYSDMPRGGGKGGMPEFSAKLEALIDRHQKKADRMAEYLEEINVAIESLENPKERLVLRYKYILRKDWKEIADAMGYKDRRPLYRLRNEALKHLEIPENAKTIWKF